MPAPTPGSSDGYDPYVVCVQGYHFNKTEETANRVYLLYFPNKRSPPSCVYLYQIQTSKTKETSFFFPTSVFQYFYIRP